SVEDSFSYVVGDGSGASATGFVNVQVNGVSEAPDDVVATPADQVLSANGPGVLANDAITGASGPLSVTGFDTVSQRGAAAVVQPDGSFTYDPTGSLELRGLADGENGFDWFTYTAQDSAGHSITPTVTIQVTGVNSAPLANEDTGTANASEPLA